MKTKFLLLISAIVLLASIVLATHVITPTSFSINETIPNTFNLTISDNNAASGNVTSINITLPAQFTFINGTNGTNATGSLNFTNSSDTLSWNNLTAEGFNITEAKYFSFNATVSFPGDYNITVNITNITSSYVTNISVQVNDSTAPTATIGTSPINYYNSSSANVTFDLKCTDTYSATNTLVLYGNWSSTWHANQTNATATNDSYWNITVANITDGTYKWTAWCNDSAGNSNWTAANRTLTVDTTNPVATATCSPSSVALNAVVTCSCSGTDTSGSGVNTTAASSTPSTAAYGTFTYTCTATDFAGNSHSNTATYIVTTDNVDIGGSTTSTTTAFWTKGTHILTDEQFTNSLTKELSAKQRFRVKVDSQDHHVGVIELTSTTATINISSAPQQATLIVGDERMFEVSGDDYYDILVKLNSIESSKASITIQSIHELVTEDTTAGEDDLQDAGETTAGDEAAEEESNVWWISGIIILILIIVGIIYAKKK